MKRNQRKIQILSLLLKEGELSAEEIYEKLKNTSRTNVMALLLRYKEFWLISRVKIGGIFHYQITPKGKKRLKWFRFYNS